MALSTFVKEFFGRVQLVMKTSAASQIDVLAETDGTPKVVNYGYGISDALIPFQLEAEGEQMIVNYGKQTGGTLGAFNLNANNVLRVELVGDPVPTDPTILGSAAAVFNPGSTAAETYDVWFNVVNYGTVAAVANVGVDLGGGTTFDRYYMESQTIPDNDQTGWYGPYQLAGDDDVVASCATATTLVIHIRARRIE